MKKIDADLNLLFSRLELFTVKDVIIDKKYTAVNNMNKERKTVFNEATIIFILVNDFDEGFNETLVYFTSGKTELVDEITVEFKQGLDMNELEEIKKKKKKKKYEKLTLTERIHLVNCGAEGMFKTLCFAKIKNEDLAQNLLKYTELK